MPIASSRQLKVQHLQQSNNEPMRIGSHITLAGWLLASLSFLAPAYAGEMRSVQTDVAILYDGPSLKAKRLYLVRKQTPLEVLVNLDGMSKVRDAEGALTWIEKSALSETRTVVVTANKADIRQAANATAPAVLEAEKWVVLELLELPNQGFAKVKHREGITGFIKASLVWGI